MAQDFKQNFKKWWGDIADELKTAFANSSARRVMRDEVGKYLSIDMASGLYENSKEVVKAFDAMLFKLDCKRKLDLINDDEYYTELEKLRDRYFVAGSKEWLKYTEKIYAYEQKLLDDLSEQYQKAYKKTYDDIYSYAQKKLGEVMKKQEDYAEKLRDYGNLFQKVTIETDDETIEYYRLSDLKKDTEAISKYNELLQKVKTTVANGIDAEAADSFLKELSELSIDVGTEAMEGILRSSPMELSQYLAEYSKKLKLADGISAKEFASEMESARQDSYDYMVEKLTEWGFEVPDSFFESGTVSARNFGQAFADELDIELGKIKDIIDNFNKKLEIDINSASDRAQTANQTVNNYTASYQIKPSFGESTHAQLRLARDYEEFQKMRRGF